MGLAVVPLLLAVVAAPARAVECAPGTRPEVQKIPGKGETEEVCLDVQGRRQGPAVRRDVEGAVIATGAYVDNQPEGTWKLVERDGLVRVGQMKAGAPVGAWTTLSGAEAVATVTWGHLPPGGPPRTAPSGGAAAEAGSPEVGGDAAVRWTHALPGPAADLVGDGAWVWALSRQAVSVLDVDTGELQLLADPGEPLKGPLLLGGGGAAVVAQSGELVVIDPVARSWRRVRTPVGITHVAAVAEDLAWVRDGAGRLAALDMQSGAVRWRGRHYTELVAPVVEADAVVGVRGGGRLIEALDPEDGEFAWQLRVERPVVALAGGQELVAALSQDGTIVLARADSGAVRWERSLPELGGGAVLELAADGLSVRAGTTVRRLSLLDGSVQALPHLDPSLRGDADAVGDTVCVAAPTGLSCVGPDGAWGGGTGPPAGAPRLVPGLVLLPLADGRLQAIDRDLARLRSGLAPEPGAELIQDVLVPAVLAGLAGEQDAVELPYLELRRPSPSGACDERVVLVDLQDAAPWPTAEEAFGPAPLELGDEAGEDAQAEPATPERLPWAEVGPVPLPGWADAPAEPWRVEPTAETWSMAWWYRWQPRIVGATLRTVDPGAQAGVEAALRCEGPPVAFRGEALLEESSVVVDTVGRGKRAVPLLREVVVRHSREGRLSLHPQPQDVDGIGGCLIELRRNGESEGWWASPELGAWEQLVLTVRNPTEEIRVTDAQGERSGLPLAVEGEVSVEMLVPFAATPQAGTGTGPFELRYQRDDLLDTWRLELWQGKRPWLAVRADELRPARVEEVDGRWLPVPEHHFDGLLHHEGRAAPAADLGVVWVGRECGESVE